MEAFHLFPDPTTRELAILARELERRMTMVEHTQGNALSRDLYQSEHSRLADRVEKLEQLLREMQTRLVTLIGVSVAFLTAVELILHITGH